MASLNDLCTALQTTIITYYEGQGQAIQVYGTVPGSAASPAIIVEPATGDYHAVMGSPGGTDHQIVVHAMVHMGDRASAQYTLNEMISETGALSVVAAIHSDRTLGGVVRRADPQRYRDYGTRSFEGTNFLMASIDVAVLIL